MVINHHAEPFFLRRRCTFPEGYYLGSYIGLRHNEQLISHVLAQVAAVGLCLVWTFPVPFFTSLSEARSLKNNRNVPLDRSFLARLSPVLLVSLTALLPVVIGIIWDYEGRIATADFRASLMTKLASFMVSSNEVYLRVTTSSMIHVHVLK